MVSLHQFHRNLFFAGLYMVKQNKYLNKIIWWSHLSMKTIKSGQYICYCLWQRLANFFCKWPDNIHFGALQATGFVTHTVNPLHTNIQFVTFQRQERAFQHQVWVKLQLALSLLLLTILQLYRLSPPLPPVVSNSACLFTRWQPVWQLFYCTTALFIFVVVQLLGRVWLFATPRTAAH